VLEGETILRILTEHAKPTPLDFADEVVDSPLWPVIERACRKDKKERFSTATEMIAALEALGELSDKRGTPKMWGVTLTSEVRRLSVQHTKEGRETADTVANDGAALRDTAASSRPEAVAADRAFKETVASASRPAVEVNGDPEALPGRSRNLAPLFVVAALAVAVAAVAFALTGGDGGGSEGTDAENAEVAALAEPSGESPQPHALASPEPDEGSEVEGSGESPEPSAELEEAPVEAVDQAALTQMTVTLAIAAERVGSALPQTHTMRFEGLDEARVMYGETLLGEVPFEGVVPRVEHALELRFERNGYRPQTQQVSLAQAAVEVDLRRRRNRERGNRPERSEPEAAPTSSSPFGSAPIDRSNP